MKRKFLVTLGTLVYALMLSACGNLTQSPAHDLTFKAPPGFASRASIMGMMQIWTAASDTQQMMLFRMPAAVGAKQGISSANLKDAKVLKKQQISICGAQPATYLVLSGTKAKVGSQPQRDEMVQMVMLKGKKDTVFSMYAYPKGTKPNPAAEQAMRQLCRKSGPTS